MNVAWSDGRFGRGDPQRGSLGEWESPVRFLNPIAYVGEEWTVREGIDCVTPPTPAALRAAGRDFVVRYARSTGSLSKGITAAEAARWKAAGVDVAIVDEVGASRALDGHAAGAADAKGARAAVVAVGGPADGVIYFAVDFDATAAQIAGPVRQYIAGAASVLGAARTGVYGHAGVIGSLVPSVCTYGFQTYAWSGGALSSKARLYQYNNDQTLGGVGVDYVRAYATDFGQWEDDVTKDDVVAALREVFHLPAGGLAVPSGQPHNGGLAVALLGQAQAAVNRDNAEAAAIATLAATVTDTHTAVLALAQAINTEGWTDAQRSAFAAQVAAAVSGVAAADIDTALAAQVTS